MSRKTLLLGLDGASWNLLDRLIDLGAMPNLARLAREGARATLESTIPPITPVAWTSLMTGANPGRHGIFGFKKRGRENTYLSAPINRMDMQVPTLFDYYREGGRLVSLNLPMSYPATPVNGFMVSGMMTPLKNPGDFEHPRGLLERFARAGIDYVIDPKFQMGVEEQARKVFQSWRNEGADFIRQLGAITSARVEALRLLLREEDWQLAICVIVGTDRIQHLYWDRLLPEDGSEPEPFLVDYYRQVDEHIGELAAGLGSDCDLLIVSDHGFVRHHGSFLTNEWLRRHGWLAPRQASRSPLYPLKRLLDRLGISRQRVARLIGERRASRVQLAAAHVDWARSRAYLGSPFGIRINLKGRETLGLVEPEAFERVRDEIIAALRDLRDPEGRPVLARVLKGEEIYPGEARHDAADIVYVFRDDRNHDGYMSNLGPEVFSPTSSKTGDHRIDGIMVAWGGGIRPAEGDLRFRIWDVLPTVMHLNGRAVPEICDGRVLQEILREERPVRIDADWRRFQGERREVEYGEGQEEEINERLRALGYLADD